MPHIRVGTSLARKCFDKKFISGLVKKLAVPIEQPESVSYIVYIYDMHLLLFFEIVKTCDRTTDLVTYNFAKKLLHE